MEREFAGKPKYSEKIYSSVIMIITYPTWRDVELNTTATVRSRRLTA
jgi:hypothetical protein